MEQSNYKFILAKLENFKDYLQIRSEKKNLYWTGYEKPPDTNIFFNWYKNRLLDPNRDIYLLYDDEICLASLHIDYYEDFVAIGYSVKVVCEGRGIGTFLVKRAIELVIMEKKNRNKLSKIIAWINEKNIASRKVIQRNRFIKSDVSEVRMRFGIEEIYYRFEILI